MKSNWTTVERVYHAALARPAAERVAFLSEACGGDAELQREVESLLAQASAASEFLGGAAVEAAAKLMTGEPSTLIMVGETISHYRILEKLGGGGMGVVYKARDLRLDRFVALKFLPPELTRDDEANKRFIHEARAASALDHPHICVIHEIDQTPDGQVFLTMAYYHGETLKKRIERGPLGVEEALELAIQIAQGLARAHESGIVHRDIKPANVMVTADGLAKILDFGIAKLAGQTDLTRTGTTVGTVSYMSPEQIRGGDVDHRADIWALGVVLYEMLTGQRPFGGDDLVVPSAILNDTPQPIGTLRENVPPRLQQIVSQALEKNVAARYHSTADLLKELTACQIAMTESGTKRADARAVLQLLRRPKVAIPAGAILVILGVLAGVAFGRNSRERWAHEAAIPQIMKLLTEGDNRAGAFALAEEAERYLPNDPVLAGLWPQIAAAGSIVTTPDGANVYMREYAATDGDWEYLGRAPLKDMRLPRGVFQFRIEKDGFETQILAARNPGSLLQNQPALPPVTTSLMRNGIAPDMVPVPGGAYPVSLSGFNVDQNVRVDPFLIDRHEVTNKEFKQFVDGGGYTNQEYWRGLSFVKDDHQLTWQEAMGDFRDSTGRPGPAVWELAEYPTEQENYPVAGVSWYEAAAYCQFRGKTLPTLFHWARAAMSPAEVGSPLAPAIIPLSNFSKKGPAPVETYRGMGPYGTYDMAGNVKEWGWNEAAGSRRWMLGGAWNDPENMFVVPNNLPPFDRSATNGFRCARYEEGAAIPDRLLAHTEMYSRDYRTAKAVSDEVFEVFKQQFSLVKSPLNQRVDWTDTSGRDWVREEISFDAGYESERVTAILFLPRNVQPPYQVLVYFPGLSVAGKTSSENLQLANFDYVVKGGRALVWPIWKGSFERWDPFVSLVGDEYLRTFRMRMFHWRQDLGRALDTLSARDDIDMNRIGYLGLSFGSSIPLPLLALEDRLKAAVLVDPGFTFRLVPPEADAINYVAHVKMPVLMLNGRHDYVFPLETSQVPLFDRWGTPPAHKRHVVFEAGHADHPRSETIREVLAWLDRYLGSVRSSAPQR